METWVTSSTAERRERSRELMRADILQAARRILDAQGVKGLAMRALGRAVGVTAPTLYDYFASKEEVLNAMHREGTRLLTEEFEATVAGTEPGLGRLEELGWAYRRFGRANPDLYLLIFGRVDASYRPGEEEGNCAKGVFGLFIGAVQEAIDLGQVCGYEAEALAHILWFSAHGFVSLEISGFLEEFASNQLDELFAATLRRFNTISDPGHED